MQTIDLPQTVLPLQMHFTNHSHQSTTTTHRPGAHRSLHILCGCGCVWLPHVHLLPRSIHPSVAMATTTLLLLLCAVVVLAPSTTTTTAATADSGYTTFKLYFHDIVGGTSPTAIRVAQSPSTNSSSTFFGAVVAIDDPLTSGPTRSSSGDDELGRAQGTYTFADQKTFGLLMAMNFVFTAGDYNGSSLSIFGRNQVLDDVREMSIVGGTGKFRMARGYVQAHTVDSGNTSGETVVQYTVNVKA